MKRNVFAVENEHGEELKVFPTRYLDTTNVLVVTVGDGHITTLAMAMSLDQARELHKYIGDFIQKEESK